MRNAPDEAVFRRDRGAHQPWLSIASCLIMFVFFLFIGTTSVLADEQGKAQARDLYRRGMQHYNLAEFEPALKDFTEAYRFYDDPAFLFNIAQCHRQLSHHRDALTFYRSYLRNMPDAENRNEVIAVITKLEGVISEENRAHGSQAIHSAEQGESAIARGPKVETALDVPKPPAQLPSDRRSRADESESEDRLASIRPRLKIAGLTTGAVGVVSLIVGGVFGGLAQAANYDLNHPLQGMVFDSSVEHRMNTDQNVEIALLSIGGAMVATGLVLAIVGFRKPFHSRSQSQALLTPLLAPWPARAVWAVSF